ncbi:uncharacterized protein [Amphiura filiformis]|uniref:uncharacterized protein n=1 Tax=Amphiura filiformis TaxID=82378 RepID=UPI003B2148FD
MPQSSPPSLTNDENQSSLKTNHPSSKPSEVQSKPPTCLETPQRHHSNSCRLQPRNLLSQLNSTKEPPSPQKSDCNLFYTACCLTTGGDWEGLAKFVGLSGPNGKFFCNHCLATLDQVPKGMPHAAHILPKYNQYAQECEYTLRTFDGCKEKSTEYEAALEAAETGSRTKSSVKAMNFENCVNSPLLTGGNVIDTVSTTPLHISLGLGLHILNIIEGEAIKLDKEIKDSEGHYDAFNVVYERKKEILLGCQEQKLKIEEVEEEINQVNERKRNIIKERAIFFKPDKKGRLNNSDIAVGVRERFAQLGKEKDALLKEKEKLEKSLKAQENKLSKVLAELDNIKGPFKTRVDDLLDSMKLKRAAYHSGALIGPDVKKLIENTNILKFSKVFEPIELKVHKHLYSKSIRAEEEFEVLHRFGSEQLQVKLVALLKKFSQCYKLYTANRPF